MGLKGMSAVCTLSSSAVFTVACLYVQWLVCCMHSTLPLYLLSLSTLPFQTFTDRLLLDPIKIRFDKLGRAARYASAGLVVGACIHELQQIDWPGCVDWQD